LAMMGGRREIAELQRDVEEMERMVNSYLAFARGEGAEQPSDIDLVALVEDAVADARRHGADISLNIDSMELPMRIRADALRRALNNVLANAERYGKRIEVSLHGSHGMNEIIVDDDGPGIPPEMREEVFKPFFRLETSRNIETGGIGLGLSIARDILRGHGGDITLSGSPLGGLRATLRVPV